MDNIAKYKRTIKSSMDYCISRKYFVRPVFEDNEEILDAFTEYEKILSEIKTLKNRIKAMK